MNSSAFYKQFNKSYREMALRSTASSLRRCLSNFGGELSSIIARGAEGDNVHLLPNSAIIFKIIHLTIFTLRFTSLQLALLTRHLLNHLPHHSSSRSDGLLRNKEAPHKIIKIPILNISASNCMEGNVVLQAIL